VLSPAGSISINEGTAVLSDGTGYRDRPGRLGRDQRLWSGGRSDGTCCRRKMNAWAL